MTEESKTGTRGSVQGWQIYLFPIAFLLNSASITLLLICAGLAGKFQLAADIGVVQGATLAIFFAFSANARNIILKPASSSIWMSFLKSRLLLLLPLGAIALALSSAVTDLNLVFAGTLVIRRCTEWLAEIYLSLMESERRIETAKRFAATQLLLLLIVVAAIVLDSDATILVMAAWSLGPLVLCARFMIDGIQAVKKIQTDWALLLPHFGSSAVNGITVLVFRTLILSFVGKEFAGTLFTAFALGGVFGSVFAQALGPTLQFHSKARKEAKMPRWFDAVVFCNFALGVTLFALGASEVPFHEFVGGSSMFWKAVGASLIGSVVMVFAQIIRLRLLQGREGVDVFGADVLINILIVSCVPFFYDLFGIDVLTVLFLINSLIAYLFYFSTEKANTLKNRSSKSVAIFIANSAAILIVVPVFIQLDGNVFRESSMVYDHGGEILRLPIPLSVIACYGGALLLGRFESTHVALWMIFSTFILMVIATIASSEEATRGQQQKFILMVQFLLPMFALTFGNMNASIDQGHRSFERLLLLVLFVIVTAQLLASLIQNRGALTPYLYLFSIYQHIQFVATIVCSSFVLALFSLWGSKGNRRALLALAAPMGLYASYSTSYPALGALVVGCIAFLVFELRVQGRSVCRKVVLMVILVVAGCAVGQMVTKESVEIVPSSGSSDVVLQWKHHLDKISSTERGWAFGETDRVERTYLKNAQNYYLDFAVNFGIPSVVPMLVLIGFTACRIFQRRREVLASAPVFGLVIVVGYLLVCSNSVAVGLRQPYPGIFTFFLWGVLLTRLSAMDSGSRVARPGKE